MKSIITLLVIIVAFCSCKQKELDPIDYVKYVEDESNGLHLSKQIGDILYSIQYKPAEYMMLKEGGLDQKKSVSSDYNNLLCFNMRIQHKNKKTDVLSVGISDDKEYMARLDYMTFQMKDDIYLIDRYDTLNCSFFHSVRNYSLAPYADFVLVFENKTSKKESNEMVLVFDDKIFGNGIIKFQINNNDIIKIPILKI